MALEKEKIGASTVCFYGPQMIIFVEKEGGITMFVLLVLLVAVACMLVWRITSQHRHGMANSRYYQSAHVLARFSMLIMGDLSLWSLIMLFGVIFGYMAGNMVGVYLYVKDLSP